MVFVHGSLSDLRSWGQQLPAIAESHRAIAYSRRYAYPNEEIPAGLDDQMPPHVDDLVSFLEAIDAAPAHLVGSSWGGFVCLLTAIRRPELVRTLVLEEPPVLSLFVSTPRARRSCSRSRQAAEDRACDPEVRRRFASGALGRKSYRKLSDERKQQARQNLGSPRAFLLGAGFPPLAEDEVRGVVAPTLLLTGERSPALPLRLTDRLEQLLPSAERIEIAGASHRVHEENPVAVNDAILAFLDRPASRTSRGGA